MEDPEEDFSCPAGSKVPGSTLPASPITSMARPTGTPGVGGLAEVTRCPRISPPGLLGLQLSSKFHQTASPSCLFYLLPHGKVLGRRRGCSQHSLRPGGPCFATGSHQLSATNFSLFSLALLLRSGTHRPLWPPTAQPLLLGMATANITSQKNMDSTALDPSCHRRAGCPKAPAGACPQRDEGYTQLLHRLLRLSSTNMRASETLPEMGLHPNSAHFLESLFPPLAEARVPFLLHKRLSKALQAAAGDTSQRAGTGHGPRSPSHTAS